MRLRIPPNTTSRECLLAAVSWFWYGEERKLSGKLFVVWCSHRYVVFHLCFALIANFEEIISGLVTEESLLSKSIF